MTYSVSFLTDEDCDQPIMTGLLPRHPGIDIVRVIDRLTPGASDPEVLELAAREDRVLLTHDISTMLGFATQRIADGERMTRIIEIPRSLPRRQVIDDLELVATCALPNEFVDRILFLPLL